MMRANGTVTLGDVVQSTGWTPPHAGMTLLRARRAGLARRDGHGRYRLSRRGQARIDWLMEGNDE
jgi:DNA-binding IclR family transcriptional regulator